MILLVTRNRNIKRPYISIKRLYDPVFNPEIGIYFPDKITVSSYDKILVSAVINFLIPYSVVTA